MTIGNYEFGLIRGYKRKIKWKKYSKISASCKCVIYEFGPFYITFLSKECTEPQVS